MALTLLAACGGETDEPAQDTQTQDQQQTEQQDQQPQEGAVNARVQEIEDTLMEQIGEMPAFNGGENLGLSLIHI